jgi:hypothetical protein
LRRRTRLAADNLAATCGSLGRTQTSGDQPNDSPDIKTTAAIRHAVYHDSPSMMAKNVKIITETER